MATYPNIKINSTVRPDDAVAYLPSNVFIGGFTPRGPHNQQTTITALSSFVEVFGSPDTAAEYSMYEAVKNTVLGGGKALCYRIPYVTQKSLDLPNLITYYCDANTTSPITSIIANLIPTDISATESYIESVVSNTLGSDVYEADTAYTWSLTPHAVNTHSITLECVTNTRTMFNHSISGDAYITDDDKHTSLGIIPVLMGSLNNLLVSTGQSGVQDILKEKLQTAIRSVVLNDNIFDSYLLSEYRYLLTANDLYVDCLDLIYLAPTIDNEFNTRRSITSLAVVELFINKYKNITVKVHEFFAGVLNNNATVNISNLSDIVNKYSNFITMTITQLTDEANQFDEEELWHYVEVPTVDNPLYAFGINGDAYDCVEFPDTYVVNSDNIFGYDGIPDHIDTLSKRTFIDRRIYDYIAMPAVIDCFNYSETLVKDERINNNVTYNSAEYNIPHTFTDSKLSQFEYDMVNVKALLQLATNFGTLDVDSTVFFDLPLRTSFDIMDIANLQSSDALTSSAIIKLLATTGLYQSVKQVTSKQYSNIMFTFNHQYVDIFDATTGSYTLVPPSAAMLYIYCYADYYRVATPLAGSKAAPFFKSCHGGLISNKNRTILKTLFDAYLINSLMSDINNNIMPNQQMLCASAGKSIFAQHHAFRLKKYLKRHLYNASLSVLNEPNTVKLREQFSRDINALLQQYKANGVLDEYKVICDSSNNTDDSIDNNELYCTVKFSVFGAIVACILNITRDGVNISIA